MTRKRALTSVAAEESGASISPTTANTIRQLLIGYHLDGTARNLKKLHLEKRHRALVAFVVWLESERRLTTMEAISSQDISAYLAHQRALGHKPSSIKNTFGILRAWFSWLENEGDLSHSPVKGMRAPKVVESPPPVLPEDAIKAMLATCAGNSFKDRRDNAILRLLIDTGLRSSELLEIRLEHIDWQRRTIVIPDGKGGYRRVVRFGRVTANALNRYMRERSKQKHADNPYVWLTQRGHMCYMSLYRVVVQRGQEAGLGHTWPHLMRHEFAHLFLKSGGQERSLMKLAGWTNSAMLARYGASQAVERALADHDSFSPGDRF